MAAAKFSPLPDFYIWGFSSAPIQIHLSLKVVSRIRKQIENSEKAPGELSGYGLLTGETSTPGLTRIRDFKSLQTLDTASVELATRSAFGEIVGFYRTTPQGGTSMVDEDRALAASLFRHPSSVFLLIETEKSSIGEARFCFWSEADLFDWPMMLFPFDAEELAIKEGLRRSSVVREPSQSSYAGHTQVTSPVDERVDASPEVGPGIVSAPPEAQPVWPAEHRPESIAPEPVAEARQGTGRRWLPQALATVVAASLLVGAFLYFRRGSNLPVASPAAASQADVKTPLGLAVEKRGSDLLVSWNRSATIISEANFGMLLIRGSEVSRDVPLTAVELRTGSVVYESAVDQVRFQLNVVAGEQVARESLAVVLPRIP